jgi:hypothetical protein
MAGPIIRPTCLDSRRRPGEVISACNRQPQPAGSALSSNPNTRSARTRCPIGPLAGCGRVRGTLPSPSSPSGADTALKSFLLQLHPTILPAHRGDTGNPGVSSWQDAKMDNPAILPWWCGSFTRRGGVPIGQGQSFRGCQKDTVDPVQGLRGSRIPRSPAGSCRRGVSSTHLRPHTIAEGQDRQQSVK